jgi:hypothetical protein
MMRHEGQVDTWIRIAGEDIGGQSSFPQVWALEGSSVTCLKEGSWVHGELDR